MPNDKCGKKPFTIIQKLIIFSFCGLLIWDIAFNKNVLNSYHLILAIFILFSVFERDKFNWFEIKGFFKQIDEKIRKPKEINFDKNNPKINIEKVYVLNLKNSKGTSFEISEDPNDPNNKTSKEFINFIKNITKKP